MADYVPSPVGWVAKQVEEYEGSNGTKGTTLLDTGLPVIIVTHTGRLSGAVRKTPLMTVKEGDTYILVGSMGGAPKNPVWVYNLRENPTITIRDETVVKEYRAREVADADERERVWQLSVDAYPPYAEYKAKTERVIPIFVAEPI